MRLAAALHPKIHYDFSPSPERILILALHPKTLILGLGLGLGLGVRVKVSAARSASPENTERGQTRVGGRGDSPERQFVRLAAALHPKILILTLHPNRFRALETL